MQGRPKEDPLVQQQRLQAERSSIQTQQGDLQQQTSRIMRLYGGKSLFNGTSAGKSLLGTAGGMV